MLIKIESLQIFKKGKSYKLEFTAINESGEKMVIKAKIAQPFMQVSIDSDSKYSNLFNRTAFFHFDAEALKDNQDNLFTITAVGKRRKTFIPKKYRKRDKKSSKRWLFLFSLKGVKNNATE